MDHAEAVLDRAALIRRWQELGADPDAPDHYELNEYGELILAPRPTNDHQRIVQEVAVALMAALGHRAVPEISVMTDRGIRVPDVVWMPGERWDQVKGKTPLPFVPDVCVEVLSPRNNRAEIAMKAGACLRGGAKEVVVVGLQGEIEFFGPEGKRGQSALGMVLALPSSLF
jgi:Uma2 family endonuclease